MLQGLQRFLALFLSHTPFYRDIGAGAGFNTAFATKAVRMPSTTPPRQKVPVQGSSCTRRLCERTRSERPAVAEARELLSYREADNVVEITGGAVVMTLTERENRYLPLPASGWNDGVRNEYGDG